MSLASEPGVTVVIPCFNQGAFIADCIQSLERQTYPSWRAIVLDDASTDGETPASCDAVRSERVSVVHLPRNHGRASARHVGIGMTETEAILSLDADDMLEPGYLARSVPALLDDPRCGIVYTDYRLFGADTRIMRARPFDEAALYRTQYIYGGNLFRLSAYRKTPGYRAEFNIGNEDWDIWLSVIEAGYLGVYVPEPLYLYRRHTGAWSSQNRLAYADKILRSRQLLRDLHREGFERSGQLRSFDYDTWFDDGLTRLRAGDAAGARRSLRRAAALRPWSPRPYGWFLRACFPFGREGAGPDAASQPSMEKSAS